MNVFLINGPVHYLNLISQQVLYKDLKDHPMNGELVNLRSSLVSACCKTRVEILGSFHEEFESLVEKITVEETEYANKLLEACNCQELVFSCMNPRNNVKKEIHYEKQS